MTREQIEAEIKRIKDANAEDEGLCKAFLVISYIVLLKLAFASVSLIVYLSHLIRNIYLCINQINAQFFK